MTGLRKYIESSSILSIVYVDFDRVFRVNVNNKDHDKIAQFEWACKESGIVVKYAGSQQAKGLSIPTQ
jgi:predicted ribosome quality control (RQC) complex YloA/Tae2 family protein